jgi:hypothetical protein
MKYFVCIFWLGSKLADVFSNVTDGIGKITNFK